MATPRTPLATFTAPADPCTETEIVSMKETFSHTIYGLANLLNLPLGVV